MAVRSQRSIRSPKPVELLALAYALGVAGTLWDWREHLLGPGTQPPHLVIDLGGLLVLAVLAFSGKMDYRSRSFTALYVLLAMVVLISLGPFVLVLSPFAPHLAEELWHTLGGQGTLAYQPWPKYDPSLTKADANEVPLPVNGKVRRQLSAGDTVVVP